jgi:hypothetical protein
MSEFHFGVGKGFLPRSAGRIAAKYGVGLVNFYEPGCSCGGNCSQYCPANKRHWFETDARGFPQDDQLATRVMNELREAGFDV